MPVTAPAVPAPLDVDEAWPEEPQSCAYCGQPATRSLLYDDDEMFMPVCADHLDRVRADLASIGIDPSSEVDIDPAFVDPDNPGPAPLAPSDQEMPVGLVIAIEGHDTTDGRHITPGSLTPRPLPWSLLAQTTAQHGGEKAAPAIVVGRVDHVERVPGPQMVSRATGHPFPEGTWVWRGRGVVSTNIEINGAPIAEQIERGYLTGISPDLAGGTARQYGTGPHPPHPTLPDRLVEVERADLGSATVVPVAGFSETYLFLPAQDAASDWQAFSAAPTLSPEHTLMPDAPAPEQQPTDVDPTREDGAPSPEVEGQPQAGDGSDPLAKVRREAAGYRTKLREEEKARKESQAKLAEQQAILDAISQAFTPGGEDEPADPAKLAETLAAEKTAAAAAIADRDAQLRTLAVERAAERAARAAGVDPDALLDSRSFVTAAAKLDPSSDTFTDDLVSAITKAAEANPKLKTTPVAVRSGAEIPGRSGGSEQVTREQLARMTPEQIVEAQAKGHLRNLLGGA